MFNTETLSSEQRLLLPRKPLTICKSSLTKDKQTKAADFLMTNATPEPKSSL